MSRGLQMLLTLLSGLLISVATLVGRLGPLLLSVTAVGLLVVSVRWRHWRPTRRPSDPAWCIGPLAASWLVAALLPLHQFSHHRITTAGSSIGLESTIEIFAMGVAGVVALMVIRTFEPTLDRATPPLLLFFVPIWTIASGVWSATGPYAFARGAEMAVLGLLAWATVALGRVDEAAVHTMVEVFLRWFVRITVVLVVLGVLFGPVFVNASEANLDRFTWIGAHPLASGAILASSLVIVAATPRRILRLEPWAQVAIAVAFLVALYANHSRQMWIALGLVLLLGLSIQARRHLSVRWVGVPLFLAGVVAALNFGGSEVGEYALRGDESDSLSTGNGRVALWHMGIRALDTPLDWLIGLGHGVARTLFVEEFAWAHTAHNSLLNALLSGGLIGAGFFIALLVGTGRYVISTRLWTVGGSGFTLTLLLIVMLVNGAASDNLVIPNIASTVLYLVVAVAIVHWSSKRTEQPDTGRQTALAGAPT